MGLTVKSGGNFRPAPAGTSIGICFSIVDLGTQHGSYMGKPKVAEKVRISWELPDEKMDDGRPFVISREYAATLGEKASLRKDLNSWRGRPFTEAELEGFKLEALLGVPCQLSIVHEKSGTTTYANIAAVMGVPKGFKAPVLTNPKCLFDMSDFDPLVFRTLSDYVKKKIMSSPEWKELAASEPDQIVIAVKGMEAAAESAAPSDDDDPTDYSGQEETPF